MRHCEAPIELKDPEPVKQDIANLAEALGDTPRELAFLNAPTPGQIAFNDPNDYYPTREEYLKAAAEALRYEYKRSSMPGFNLQLDSPDLAMAAHYPFGPGVGDHLEHVHAAIEALNHAIDGLPPERLRLHVCWGNYAGPHNHDVPLRTIIEPILKANVETISFEGANPTHEYEWEIFKDVKLPDDKVLMPGVIDVCNTRIEHPRVVAQRLRAFRRGRRSRAGHREHRLRLRHLRGRGLGTDQPRPGQAARACRRGRDRLAGAVVKHVAFWP